MNDTTRALVVIRLFKNQAAFFPPLFIIIFCVFLVFRPLDIIPYHRFTST